MEDIVATVGAGKSNYIDGQSIRFGFRKSLETKTKKKKLKLVGEWTLDSCIQKYMMGFFGFVVALVLFATQIFAKRPDKPKPVKQQKRESGTCHYTSKFQFDPIEPSYHHLSYCKYLQPQTCCNQTHTKSIISVIYPYFEESFSNECRSDNLPHLYYIYILYLHLSYYPCTCARIVATMWSPTVLCIMFILHNRELGINIECSSCDPRIGTREIVGICPV